MTKYLEVPGTTWWGVGLYFEFRDGEGFFEPRMGCFDKVHEPVDYFWSGAILNWMVVAV